jgi:hypothetical protein
MTYQLQNLNVASLDFDDIKSSLVGFLQNQPDLADIDFQNNASTANMLINILATATAYNGIYAQFGFVNSFATTTTLMESILGIASNNSVLVAPTQSATSSRTVTAVNATLQDYSTFLATTPAGSDTFFFNITDVPSGTSKTTILYSGSSVTSFTNYDYTTQSCELPYTVDPRTISFYETTTGTGVVTKWTRVDKGTTSTANNSNTFTVINGPRGYIVTNNFLTAKKLNTSSTVLIKAVISNGSVGNNASITSRSDTLFPASTTPSGGYDLLSVTQARYRLLFNATGQDRCVTINDYINAILSSGIAGTDDESLICVQNDCCIPGKVKIYVTGLSSSGQNALMSYLGARSVAGINLAYEQC